MGWLRLDDGFFLHPKAIAAGRDGRDVYLAALGYANQQQTDGLIPAQSLPLIGGLAGVVDYDAAASKLVEVGLWHNHVEGWTVHDFLEHQQSKEEREEWRRRDRERKAYARQSKKGAQVSESVRVESERNPEGFQAMSAKSPLYRSEVNRSEQNRSGGGGEPAAIDLRDALGGTSTTTTSDARIDRALSTVATRLAQRYARPGEEAGYRQTILRNPAEHLERIKAIAQQQPTLDPDELATAYLAARKASTPTTKAPRCGICGGDAHAGGASACPRMAS
jgi:hypothetical protein